MKQKTNEYELIVAQGKRPLWQSLLSALFFSLMVWVLYNDVMIFYQYGFNENTFKHFSKSIFTLAYCLTGGIAFAVTKTVLIDLDKDLLISRFTVGMFSHDVNSKIPQLEYVSVFLDSNENYQVNLWYIGNKHYKMYVFNDKVQAIKFAASVAIKLTIDLLDATEKGNFAWIDKTEV